MNGKLEDPLEQDPGEERGDDVLQELFLALTARWRSEDGKLAVGVPRKKLVAALDLPEAELGPVLDRLSGRIGPLGLEVVEYYHGRDRWVALRSLAACPNELGEWEQAVLGVVIAFLEESQRPDSSQVPLSKLKRLLVRGKYLSEYRLERVLANLEHLGYLSRKKDGYAYGPRTLLEFGEERRKNIHEEARELIF
ncbi:MAG: hypothetical protein HY720_15625 [Planctomycetes bacterium]|nr:hypothetical protein [Planctomycetota bacterium]